MGFINLSSVDAENFQAPNPPGVTRAFAVVGRAIQGNWPNKDIIDDDGEITALPVLLKDKNGVDAKFVEYLFPKNTCFIDSDGSGDPSYQNYKHMLNISMAGFSKEVRKEAKKQLNAGTVWIVQQKGGEFVVVASSDDPIFLNTGYKSGKGGKDKRGYEMKGEADGLAWDLPVIPAALMATLDVISVLDVVAP
jgi:hypothetical protein